MLTPLDPTQVAPQRKLAVLWSITFLILFPAMIGLGLLMRLTQGELIKVSPGYFYAMMTLHGLGMAGILYSIAFAALFYLIATRYARLSLTLGYILYGMIVLGILGLVVATLFGKFAAGWYVLYPLPFVGATWTKWSTGLTIISLIILGVAWLIGCIHVVYALSKEYGGFTQLIGWQYLGKEPPSRELPPLVMITTVSLVPGIMAYIAGAVMLIMYLMKFLESSLTFDPLLMKNLTFFFGHTLVNITMYCGVGWLYCLLPEFTGREWKCTKLVVYSWNATFLVILFAYFHHLYMDFAQPVGIQMFGQLASYFSAIPATAVTMFGVMAQVYHSKIKWGAIPTLFLLGTAGWAIGGIAAVIDSTIYVNEVMHNTLWVPAHFHTYMLVGVVLFILAFLFYLAAPSEGQGESAPVGPGLGLFVGGAYGFLLMFYLGGMYSIPRRFSTYAFTGIPTTQHTGALLAEVASGFVVLVLLGLFIMYVTLLRGLWKARS